MKQKTLGVAAISLSVLALNGCVSPTPFDPQAIEAIQKQSASENVVRELSSLPTGLTDITQPTNNPATTRPSMVPYVSKPSVRMTLQEIIHRAVASNLDVRVSGFQSAIDESRITEAEARFDPRLFSNFQFQNQNPQGVLNDQLAPPELRSYLLQSGFKQDTDLGTQLEVRTQIQKQTWNRQSAFSTARETGKSWDDQVVMQITQPLLKDFGGEVNRARITIARNDQKISQLDTRDQLEKVLQQIEDSYWKLVEAQQEVRIQEQTLKDAENTLDILIKRMANDVNMVQVAQARSAVELRAAELVRTRSDVEKYSDLIKRLMNDPQFPVAGATLILPGDEPVAQPVRLALEDQIVTALHNRLELKQQRLRIDSARVVIKAAENNMLPKLDLTAQLGWEGIDLTFKDAFNSFDDGNLINWGFGLQFEVPIGNRQARAIYRRTQLQHTQAVVQWQLQAQVVVNDVKSALREVETSWNEAVASRRAVFAAQDALDALDRAEKLGRALTPEFVQLKLDRQIALATAKTGEVRAIAGYNLALANLEKAKGTLLKYNGVAMAEEPGPTSRR